MDARVNVNGDWSKQSVANVRLDGTVDAPQGSALIKFMNLDWLVAVRNGPGQLKVQAGGPLTSDMTFEARLSADGLSAQAGGSGRLSEGEGIRAAATLRVTSADLRPILTGPAAGSSLPLQMTSRVTIAGEGITFEDIDAKLAGSGIHGRIAVGDSSPRRIDGRIESDAADVPVLLARGIGLQPQTAATGAAWSWSSEPFVNGLLGKFSGKVALKFARARVLGQFVARDLNATLRFGKDELALEDVAGALAGGRLSGGIAFRTGENGLTTHARISLARADVATLLSTAARPPVTGSLDLTAETEGTGLSPIALVGSLKGAGKILLSNGQIAGLDSRSFEVVTRAVDQGLPIDTGRISVLVGKSLDGGQLSLKRVESTVQVSAGQLRLGDVSAESKDAALSIAGTLDLTDGSVDARLILSGSAEAAGARPNIFMALKGPLTAPARSVDVSALTGWLTLRAVENQTKRLRAIENVPTQPRGRGMPNTRQAPALPAPIDVRPAPAPRSAGQPAASVRSQN
jgi:large subunit ribosomal protein L24